MSGDIPKERLAELHQWTPEQFTFLQATAKVWRQKAKVEAETLAEIRRERRAEKGEARRAKQTVPGA